MNSDYAIERDVPLPGSEAERVGETLPKMRVGDSVVAPRTSQVAWHTVARRYGASVKTKTVGEGKIRVWRIS